MRRVILAIVGTVAGLVVLLSFKTHSLSAAATPPAAISGANGQASSPAAAPGASSSASGTKSSASGGSTASGTAAKTVTGTAVDTIYGPVQVQITVRNGKITAAQAIEYPQGSPRDYQINSYAVPMLNQETVSASSASIDGVSGATYTSTGYITSLQSAVDKAGL
ncbi:MAG TPA: FMN-binding protein [Trebonia sp.]